MTTILTLAPIENFSADLFSTQSAEKFSTSTQSHSILKSGKKCNMSGRTMKYVSDVCVNIF